jgi:hypothetical protein
LHKLIGGLLVSLAAYASQDRWMPDRFELRLRGWKTATRPRSIRPGTVFSDPHKTKYFRWEGESPAPGRIAVRMSATLWYDRPKHLRWWSVEVTEEMDDRYESVWRHEYNNPAHLIQIEGPGRFHNGLDVLVPIYVEPGVYRVRVELREAVPELDPDGYAVVFSRATGPITVE